MTVTTTEPTVNPEDLEDRSLRSSAPVAGEEAVVDGDLVEEDLLVEDVSIDGMCGVY